MNVVNVSDVMAASNAIDRVIEDVQNEHAHLINDGDEQAVFPIVEQEVSSDPVLGERSQEVQDVVTQTIMKVLFGF